MPGPRFEPRPRTIQQWALFQRWIVRAEASFPLTLEILASEEYPGGTEDETKKYVYKCVRAALLAGVKPRA